MQEIITIPSERELEEALRQEYHPSRKKYFDQALENACKTEPAARKLFDKLKNIGGEHVKFQLYDGRIPFVTRLLRKGQIWSGRRSVLRNGEPCRCHSNAAEYWAGSGGMLPIVTGYALSGDNAWREHTWNISRSGTVLESTDYRAAYFGTVLTSRDSLAFFKANVYDDLQHRTEQDASWEADHRIPSSEASLDADEIRKDDLNRAVFHALRDYADHLTAESENSNLSYGVDSFTMTSDFDQLASLIAAERQATAHVLATILCYEADGERYRARGEENAYQLVVSPSGSMLLGALLKAEVIASGNKSKSKRDSRQEQTQ